MVNQGDIVLPRGNGDRRDILNLSNLIGLKNNGHNIESMIEYFYMRTNFLSDSRRGEVNWEAVLKSSLIARELFAFP